MAASAGTSGGPACKRAGWILRVVCGSLAVIAALFGVSAQASADGGVIYVNAAQGYSSADLGARILHSLGEQFRYSLARLDTDQEVMQRIAADPRSIGLVQQDRYVQYLRD